MREVITRKQALAAGQKRYYTGRPCPSGHCAERLVSSYGCIQCAKVATKVWCKENMDKKLEIDRRSRKRCREKIKKTNEAWRKKNREKIRARAAIEAMREPTEAMEDAAMDADGTNMPLAISYDDAWRAMIDEALGIKTAEKVRITLPADDWRKFNQG